MLKVHVMLSHPESAPPTQEEFMTSHVGEVSGFSCHATFFP